MDKKIEAYQLFDSPPDQWGLRGDPYLWHEMRGYFFCKNPEMPSNQYELEKLIHKAFQDLTGKQINSEDFQIKRLMHGGMSSGAICPERWVEHMIPHLIRNYEDLIQEQPEERR